MLKLKKNFQLGASTSALQTEGIGITKRAKLAFDEYYERNPEMFYNKIGPNLTNDFTNNYKEEIKLWKEIGFDSIRTGFSWARLFPDGVNVDNQAVKYYHDFLKEVKKTNIKIFMTLFHFDMPNWAQNLGGWAHEKVIESFVNYSQFVFQEYFQEVDYFVTFNEPLVPVFGGYLGQSHPPGIDDVKLAIKQALGIFIANAKVLNLYHKLNYQVPIGIVYNWNYTYALSNNDADQKAALIHDAFVNRGPLKIMSQGIIDPLLIETLKKDNLLPKISQNDLNILKETKIDFLGINYYFPSRVEYLENKNAMWTLDNINQRIPNDAKINPFRNWEIYPQGLYDVAMSIKNEFNNLSWYVAENGIGVENEERFRNQNGIINDQYRIDYVTDHLTEILKAIEQGSNCFGYHMWTITDCWSFTNAYKNRYGFIELNLKDQTRKLKKSAYWYADLIKQKGGEDDEKNE